MVSRHCIAAALVVSSLTGVGSRARADLGIGTVYIPNSIDDPTLHAVSLTQLDGSGFLRGAVADVSNAFSTIPRAFSATLDFSFDPTAPGAPRVHFAETMAYYHITAFEEYNASLGFGVAPPVVPVVVFDHIPLIVLCIPTATQYDIHTGTISLASTVECDQSDALDGDLIVHEYAHAVQHRLLGGALGVFVSLETSSSEQALALMEGTADYATASRFDDAEFGEWSAGIWQGRPFVRNVESFLRWPGDLVVGGSHPTGLIFAGALWDLRSVVGSTVADTLWLQMMTLLLDNNPGTAELNTTLLDAFNAVVQADQIAFSGVHEQDIRQAFAVHGLGSYDFSTSFPVVRDPGNDFDGLLVYSSPGAASLAVQFDQFVTKLDDSPYTTPISPEPGVDEKNTVDELIILDGADNVIGTFTGRQLQGAMVVVPGDTAKFHLVTDSYIPPFGYRVVDITATPPALPNELVVDIELAPTVEPGPLTRCITFELFDCGSGIPVIVQAEITFVAGRATGVVVPVPTGNYDCITARDRLHTLRRTDEDQFGVIPIVGAQYVADFTDRSGTGGDDDSLVGGNLNDDEFIDIVDFGIYVNRFFSSPGAGTTCTTPPAHADISGNGLVGTEDFTFIQINFLRQHDPNCCGLPGIAGGGGLPAEPIMRISVAGLWRYGLGHLVVADLNGDGVLDQFDIAAFMLGDRPVGTKRKSSGRAVPGKPAPGP